MDLFDTDENFNKKIIKFKKEVERLFSYLFESISSEELSGSFKANTPPIDIYTTNDKLVIEVEIPGVLKDNIFIKIRENILILRWTLKPLSIEGEVRFLCMERRFGKFEKFMLLPFNPGNKNVKAFLDNGVLKIIFKVKDDKDLGLEIDIPVNYMPENN